MTKKTFKDSLSKDALNPAMQFITTPAEDHPEADQITLVTGYETPAESLTEPSPESYHEEKPPRGFRLNPKFIETKSRRLQLLMQPSLYKKIQAQAKRNKVSVNEWVHATLQAVINQIEEEKEKRK